ncbi:MAG: MMPL family transporter [Pseudomonadota bacterium]
MERFCRWLLAWRVPILIGAAILTAATAAVALQVRFEFSFTQFFPSRDHPVVARYFDFMERFGRDDRVALVAIETLQGEVVEARALTDVAALCAQLAKIDGVTRVDGLPTLRLPAIHRDTLEARPLYDARDGVTDDELAALRELARASPFVRQQLLAEDLKATLVAVSLGSGSDGGTAPTGDRDPVLDRITEVSARVLDPTRYRWYLGGVPAVRAGYVALLADETWSLVLLAGAILAAVLFALFRSWRGVVLPMATVTLSALLSVAMLVLTDRGFTLMSTLIPTVVLILGIADSVHFLARFQEERERGLSVDDAVVATFRHLAVACLLTSATTAVGFVALGVSAIGVVADFGWIAALGVMVAYLVTVVVLPPLLASFPLDGGFSVSQASKQWTGRFLALHYHLAAQHSRAVVGIFLSVVLVLAAWSLHSLRRDAFFVDDLDASHPMVTATRFIEKHFGGILPVEVLIEGDHDLSEDPDAVTLAHAVAGRLRQEPSLGAVVGYSDLVRSLSQTVAGDTSLTDSPQGLAQLSLLVESGDSAVRDRFVATGGRGLRISARGADIGSHAMAPMLRRLAEDLEALARAHPGLRVQLTGFTPAAVWVDRYMVNQLFYGFALAFAIITLMTGFLFRSPAYALIALLPNLVPLVGVLAWMGLWGIALKPTTAIIFSVSFGLGVDNTIHFLTRFRSELREVQDARRALSRTLAGTGRGILFASLVLGLGFTAALFAELGTSANFAALTIVTIASALVSVLLLLPSLLLWPRRSRAPLPPTPPAP